MTSNHAQVLFTAPEQNLRTLSFCEPTPRHLAQWVDQLPMINLGESSRQLYHAIIELNKLAIDPETRLKLNEVLRPPIQRVCENLEKHYLNQPMVLPPKARKVARLAMALNNHLMIAYFIVIEDRQRISQKLLSSKPKKMTALAAYHAMRLTAQIIVRAYQLYRPAPPNAWRTLHKLFQVCESNHLLELTIEDPHNRYVRKTNVRELYKRVLMIGSCKANQVQQAEIANLFAACEMWSHHTQLVKGRGQANFVVNLSEDSPPRYSELSAGRNSPFCRGIDLSPLLALLRAYRPEADKAEDKFTQGISVPKTLSPTLISFLVGAWDKLTARAANRLPSDKSVGVCIGLSATHYFLSGGVDFDTQLQHAPTPDEAPGSRFQSRDVTSAGKNQDIWASGFDVEKLRPAHGEHKAINFEKQTHDTDNTAVQRKASTYPRHSAQLIDISPNGYCIKWDEQSTPAQIKAGEIAGIYEEGTPGWSLGVIRWVAQPRDGVINMGVELLAATAIPCGARILSNTPRKSDYMRALLLPAQEALGQPATFIAPNMPFRENVSILLNQYGETSQGLLGQRILTTASFSQFLYESEAMDTTLTETEDEDDEDIWPDI